MTIKQSGVSSQSTSPDVKFGINSEISVLSEENAFLKRKVNILSNFYSEVSKMTANIWLFSSSGKLRKIREKCLEVRKHIGI